MKRLPKTVSTLTPQRISFFGGGTDLPAYYQKCGGGVISATIDKYIYVTVKQHSPLFEESFRLSYSKTEHVNSIDEIQNDVARECIRLVGIDPPIYIATAADLPASSGLGSSSSFAVGLLNALHLLKGERATAAQLAEEACEVEISRLGNPIGKQDQYAAAFGGFNHISFKKNNRVEIDHLVLQKNLTELIFKNCLLIWTGIQRDASVILEKQNVGLNDRLDGYDLLLRDVASFKNILLNPPSDFLKELGRLLNSSWSTKKTLESSITNSEIDALHKSVVQLGGYGGKLSGAGGGGFLLEIIMDHMHQSVFDVHGKSRVMPIRFEPFGSRVLYGLY